MLYEVITGVRRLFRDELELYKHQTHANVRGDQGTVNALLHQVIGLPEDA